MRDQNQVPMWAQYLLGSEDALRSFNEWVDERKVYYAEQGVDKSEDFASVKGCRFTRGELDSIREMVNWIPNEAAAEAAYKDEPDE